MNTEISNIKMLFSLCIPERTKRERPSDVLRVKLVEDATFIIEQM